MKKISFIYFALALIASGCSKEQSTGLLDFAPETDVVSFRATFEGEASDTKLGIDTNSGALTWIDGDAIAVQMTDNSFVDFVYDSSTGKFSASLGEKKVKDDGVAYYPATIVSDGTPGSVSLPTSYTASVSGSIAKVCPPMVATVKLGDDNLALKHLGGILSIKVSYVPADANKLVLTVPKKIVTGDFSVSDGKIIAGTTNGNSTVMVTFDAGDFGTTPTEFFIPVPVTTFSGGFTVDFKNEANETLYTHSTEKTTIEAARASIKRMAELTVPTSIYVNYTEPWKEGETAYAYSYGTDAGGVQYSAWPGETISSGAAVTHSSKTYNKIVSDASRMNSTKAKIIFNINWNNDNKGNPYGDAYRAVITDLELNHDIYLTVAPVTSQATSKIYVRNWTTNSWATKVAAGFTKDYNSGANIYAWPGTLLSNLSTEYLGDNSYSYFTVQSGTWIWSKACNDDGSNESPDNIYIEIKNNKNTLLTLKDGNTSTAWDFGVAQITID